MIPFLLIGLGNPGTSYAGNRHNIGFMAVERIAEDYGFGKWTRKFGGQISEGTIDGQKILAFKPMGYMNTSGVPAQEAASFYKIPLSHIIAIHDELDLPLGRLRVKRGGGNGGHNGLKSLDDHLGKDYLRLRLGIGHPGDKELVTGHVLSDFSRQEKPVVAQVLTGGSKHINLLLSNPEMFMTKIAMEIPPGSKNT